MSKGYAASANKKIKRPKSAKCDEYDGKYKAHKNSSGSKKLIKGLK